MSLPIIKGNDILCPHFNICSGCTLNVAVDSPKVLDEAKHYFQQRGMSSYQLIADSPTGWRCRAKLAVRGQTIDPHIGLYREGTHNVVDIPFCKVHHPQINRSVELIKRWIIEENIQPYNELSFHGTLRYVQLVVERATGRVQVSLVINGHKQLTKSFKRLWDMEGPNFWHSLWANYNTNKTNVIFGSEWKLFHGEPLLWETFGRTKVCFQPASFAQANLDLFDKMLKRITDIVPAKSSVVEFYAGVGVIGLCLAHKCSRVHCIEINPLAEACFQESRAKLGEESHKITFHTGKASDFLDLLRDCDTIIVDPPRKGLDQTLLKSFKSQQGPKKLIYISCGWPSFQKDCDALLEAGWKLVEAAGYLFFPGSDHIETLAVFSLGVRL